MDKPSLEDLLKIIQSPAGSILTWAFNLSCETDALLRKQLPELTRYPNLKGFANLLQAATIVAALLRIERYLGDNDYSALHKNVVQSIDPSVRSQYMSLLQDLTAFLLKTDSMPQADIIPSFNELLNKDADVLAMTLGYWVVGRMKMAQPEESEGPFVQALGGTIYTTNAKIISSLFLSGNKSVTTEYV
jgi:hypothetical protein